MVGRVFNQMKNFYPTLNFTFPFKNKSFNEKVSNVNKLAVAFVG